MDLEKIIEEKSKAVLQKVHDSALAAGMYTGTKPIKDILDKPISNEEKLKEISVFVNNAVNVLENKVKKGE